MNTLLVGYDLNKSGQKYDDLIKRLKQYSKCWHHLDSTWLIRTEDSHKTVRDTLKKLIDSNDELLVIDVAADAAAWAGFNDEAGQWIRDNL